MIRVNQAFIVLMAFLLIHCGRVQVNSLPRMGWSKPIDRVFILCTASPSGSHYAANDLQERLARLLNSRRVITRTWSSNILDLADDDKLKAEVAAFQPRFILRVAQTSVTRTNGSETEATFDLRLTEFGVEEPVWRARTIMGGMWGGDAEKLSTAILEAMRQDGILPS